MIRLKNILLELSNERGIEVRRISTQDERNKFKYYVAVIHYLGKLPPQAYIRLGVFYDDIMIGAVAYGSSARGVLPVELGLNTYEAIELKRLVVADIKDLTKSRAKERTGQELPDWYKLAIEKSNKLHHPESQVISLANREAKDIADSNYEKDTKIITTYADSSQEHTGAIYKATNAIEYGASGKKNLFVYIMANDKRDKRNIEYRLSGYGKRKPVIPFKEPTPDFLKRYLPGAVMQKPKKISGGGQTSLF